MLSGLFGGGAKPSTNLPGPPPSKRAHPNREKVWHISDAVREDAVAGTLTDPTKAWDQFLVDKSLGLMHNCRVEITREENDEFEYKRVHEKVSTLLTKLGFRRQGNSGFIGYKGGTRDLGSILSNNTRMWPSGVSVLVNASTD